LYILLLYRYAPPSPENITKRTGHDNSNCTTIVSAAVGYYENVYEIPTVPIHSNNNNTVTIYEHRYHSIARYSFIKILFLLLLLPYHIIHSYCAEFPMPPRLVSQYENTLPLWVFGSHLCIIIIISLLFGTTYAKYYACHTYTTTHEYYNSNVQYSVEEVTFFW